MAVRSPITLLLRPHRECGGCHLDRFDAYLNGELIVTSRQPLCDGARKLLGRGLDTETPLAIQHEGKPPDPTAIPQAIGELAKWTFEETSGSGIKRRR
jgi:hypothetical protein